MLKKIRCAFIFSMVLYLAGCSKILTVPESSPLVNLPSSVGDIYIAVLDQRPYVVDGDKSPAFEGIIRSSFGIPYSHNTYTDEPMGQYLGQRIVYGFEDKGINAVLYKSEINAYLPNVMDELKSANKKAIIIVLNEWKYDYHAVFSDSSLYNIDVMVLDDTGSIIINKNFSGEEDIPNDDSIINDMLKLYKGRFEKVFSDQNIVDALS